MLLRQKKAVEEEAGATAKVQLEDKNRCWKALEYIKPRTNRTTPASKGPNGEIAVTMQDKEALVRAHAFPKPPTTVEDEYRPMQGSAHLLVMEDMVARALLCQSVKKTPGPNLYSFRIFRMIWAWDPGRIMLAGEGHD